MNFFFVFTNCGALLLWHQQTTIPSGAHRAAAMTAICFRSAIKGTLLNTLEIKTLLYGCLLYTSSGSQGRMRPFENLASIGTRSPFRRLWDGLAALMLATCQVFQAAPAFRIMS